MVPSTSDLVLGTDVSANGKPTKNFTVQSIIDLVSVTAQNLNQVLSTGNDGGGLNMVNLGSITAVTFNDGTATLSAGNLTTPNIVQSGTFQTTAGVAKWITTVLTGFTSITTTGITLNGTVGGTALVQAIPAAPAAGSTTKIVSEKAIIDYVTSNPTSETLAETLVNGNTTGATKIEIDNTNSGIDFIDDARLRLGTANDLQIYHNGSHGFVTNSTGNFEITSTGSLILQDANSLKWMMTNQGGSVLLYYNGTSKLTTTNTGVTVTGAFEATTSGTFASLVNTGTYTAGNGVGSAGQILSSTGTGTSWVTEVPLYNWSLEGTAIPSGTAVTVTDGNNITTTWDAANFDLTIAASGDGVTGTGVANQVTYWTGAQTVAGDAGMIYDATNNDLTITGTMKADTFTTTAGTATWVTTELDGFTSITSDLFIGPLQGNADTATALALAGGLAVVDNVVLWPIVITSNNQVVAANSQTITYGTDAPTPNFPVVGQVLTGTSVVAGTKVSSVSADGLTIGLDTVQAAGIAVNTTLTYTTPTLTYTSGGNVNIPTFIPDTVATSKLLTNLPTPVSSAISSSDTILAGMAKLQGQITATSGLSYEGLWNASTDSPALSGTTPANGVFYIVNVAGNTNLSGITDWLVGDWAIYVSNGSATDGWQKLDMTSDITGTGTANSYAMWTGPNSVATGLVSQNVAGNLVTIGNGGGLSVEGSTALGDAIGDTTTVSGPLTASKNIIINEGIALGSSYGTAGQVLTSGGGIGTVNTWTTPVTGTVTSVGLTETGNALTITNSPITTTGNINIAGAGSASQYINGELNLVTFPIVDDYVSWTADSDEGTDITVTSGFNLKFTGAVTAGGAGIATDSAVSANEMTIGLINAGGTPGATTFYRGDGQWSVPSGTKTETLAEVLTNGNTTGGTDIAVSAADDITFTDTSKALFGTGSDLEIYHDGSNSFIKDAGTGILNIQGNIVAIENTSGVNYFVGVDGAQVELYHNGSSKLATTSTGVSVTGNVSLSDNILFSSVNASDSALILTNEGSTGVGAIFMQAGTGSGAGGGSITCYANARAGGKDADIAVGLSDNANGQFRVNTSGVDVGTDVFTVSANGNTLITGDLTVDGAIIHGGGTSGGGTFSGDLVFAADAGDILFDLERATTGALIFDVFISMAVNSGGSTVKKYTVCHTYNTVPLYNLVLGSPGASGDNFTVAFTSVTNTICRCTLIPSGGNASTVSYTIIVGNDNTLLTFSPGT
jgi:hypothetical protein